MRSVATLILLAFTFLIKEVIAESQLVMVAWGSWSPYHHDANDGGFSRADTITVPLVGGHRANPDDRMCLANLAHLGRRQYQHSSVPSMSGSGGEKTMQQQYNNDLWRMSSLIDYRMTLRFNFAMLSAAVSGGWITQRHCRFAETGQNNTR